MRQTLLQTITAVASELAQSTPTVVLSATDGTTKQLYALLLAVCDELTQAYEWEQLQISTTFNTVANQPAYAVPSDLFKILNGTLWDRTNQWPIVGPKTPTEWAILKGGLYNGAPRTRFRIQGDKFVFTPIPTAVLDIAFDYISYNYVIDGSTGDYKAAFTSDSDKCIFDDRLVINALKLKFLETKGLNTVAALAAYEASLDAAMGADGGAQVLSINRRYAYPLLSALNLPETGYGS